MTNGEKYKTAQERYDAFLAWCDQYGANCHNETNYGAITCAKCQFAWLDLEAEEEKPLPCPFCGSECSVEKDSQGWSLIQCTSCNYSSCGFKTRKQVIAAHNRVAKKCVEVKE